MTRLNFLMDNIRAYLFDFDGTLVDTMGGFADIAAEAISSAYTDIEFSRARELYIETSGAPFFQQMEIIRPGGALNEAVVAEFERRKQEGFFRASFSDEVRGTLSGLRKAGKIVGVSSNNFQELIEKFIERDNLIFDLVLGYRKNFEKGRDHFNYYLEKFDLIREELVFVGDSLKDAEKAFGFGINFIGLCGTFKRENFVQKFGDGIRTIERIRELTL